MSSTTRGGTALLVPWLDLPLSHVHEGILYPCCSSDIVNEEDATMEMDS